MLDASINMSMEPFRAFVGDQLAAAQRPTGYAMQSFFIGVGAVVASCLPWLLDAARRQQHGTDAAGALSPDTVHYSFYLGAIVLFGAVAWTVLRTREYPPEALHAFADATPERPTQAAARGSRGECVARAGLGCDRTCRGRGRAPSSELDQAALPARGLSLAWGLALLVHAWFPRHSACSARSCAICDEHAADDAPAHAGAVLFMARAVRDVDLHDRGGDAGAFRHSSDPASAAYNDGANWVGVLFGAYNGFAALAAIVIPFMVRTLGLRVSHLVNVWLGGFGLHLDRM